MTVAAMLGVLYSGNFYVPLDRQMPRQRMKQLLEQLQPEALIFSQAAEELAAEFSPLCPLFLLEEAVIPRRILRYWPCGGSGFWIWILLI